MGLRKADHHADYHCHEHGAKRVAIRRRSPGPFRELWRPLDGTSKTARTPAVTPAANSPVRNRGTISFR